MMKNRSLLRTYALAAIVSFGILAVWVMVIAWGFGLVESASYRDKTYEQLYVSQGGEPLILRYRNGLYLSPPELLTITGQPAKVDSSSLLQPLYTTSRNGMHTTARFAGVSDGAVPVSYWYLVHDGRSEGSAYGIGYHSVTKRVVGYFGRKGFANQLPPRSEWFEIAGNSGLLFATPNVTHNEPRQNDVLYLVGSGKLWAIDPRNRIVRTLGDAPTNASLGMGLDLAKARPEPTSDSLPKTAVADPAVRDDDAAVLHVSIPTAEVTPKMLVLRSGEFCTVVDPATGERADYPLPVEVRKEMFSATHLADGNLLLISLYSKSDQANQLIMRIDPSGRVLERHEFRISQLGVAWGGETGLSWFSVLAAPSFIGQLPVLYFLPASHVQSGHSDSFWQAVGEYLRISWLALSAVIVMGAIAALAAYRRQRRFGLPGAMGWAVFVFLLGVPGWLSYRFHRRWPVREECPACRQSAPRDRDACIECGASYPPPPLKGIEVFA